MARVPLVILTLLALGACGHRGDRDGDVAQAVATIPACTYMRDEVAAHLLGTSADALIARDAAGTSTSSCLIADKRSGHDIFFAVDGSTAGRSAVLAISERPGAEVVTVAGAVGAWAGGDLGLTLDDPICHLTVLDADRDFALEVAGALVPELRRLIPAYADSL